MATFDEVQSAFHEAVDAIYDADQRVQAVGIGRSDGEYVIRAVRNSKKVMPLSASTRSVDSVSGVRITYVNAPNDVQPAIRLPAVGPGSPFASSFVPEQSHHRPLCCGLQIQNFDDDVRLGNQSYLTVGSLGCLVQLPGKVALLSNNHVIAGENSGVVGADRILQPGTASASSVANEQVAFLTAFETLATTPAGVTPASGLVKFNVVDAAVAELNAAVSYNQGYLPFRSLPRPAGRRLATHGDLVFKVGRTTGLTHGEVTATSVVVGPVPYRPGLCWFSRSIEIEGVGGTLFSDHGDSGSAIVMESTAEVVGLLYAGNGVQTYACPIDDVLNAFGATIF